MLLGVEVSSTTICLQGRIQLFNGTTVKKDNSNVILIFIIFNNRKIHLLEADSAVLRQTSASCLCVGRQVEHTRGLRETLYTEVLINSGDLAVLTINHNYS